MELILFILSRIPAGSTGEVSLFCLTDKITTTNRKDFHLSALLALPQVKGSALHQSSGFTASKKEVSSSKHKSCTTHESFSILSATFSHNQKRFISPLKGGSSIVSSASAVPSHSQKPGTGNTVNARYL